MADSNIEILREQFEQIRDERGLQANTATRIGNAFLSLLSYVEEMDLPYLRKDIDDIAAGVIAFTQGITMGSGGYDISADGDATLRSLIIGKYGIDADGNGTLNKATVDNISIGGSYYVNNQGGAVLSSVTIGEHGIDEEGNVKAKSLAIGDYGISEIGKAVLDYIKLGNYSISSNGEAFLDRVMSYGFDSSKYGELGSGYVLEYSEDEGSYLEIDKLLVRKLAYFVQIVIKELKHVGGTIILSPASMTCSKVTEYDEYYRCFFEKTDSDGRSINQEFVAGDQARCQTFNIQEGVSENVSNRYYWRYVVSVGEDYIDLSKTDYDSGSLAPEKGDEIVQLGNRTDTDRQNAIILSTVGEDAPSIKQYTKISSYNLAEAEVITALTSKGNTLKGTFYSEASSESIESLISAVETALSEYKTTTTATIENLGDEIALRVTQTEYSDKVTALEASIKANADGISVEVAKREEDIETLSSRVTITETGIAAEILDRQNADTELSNTITATAEEIKAAIYKSDGTYTWTSEIAVSAASLTSAYEAELYDENGNMIYATSTELKQTADGITATVERQGEDIEALQADWETIKDQVDQEYTIWFYDYDPTSTLAPTSEWTDDETKAEHVEDLFYNTESGQAYRYVEDDGVYQWAEITDAQTVRALEKASTAQDTADGKRRVFVDTPSAPYDVGDMWTNVSYTDTDNGVTYEYDLLVCKTAKAEGESFSISDWTYASESTNSANIKILSDMITLEVKNRSEAVSKIEMTADQISTKVTAIEKDYVKSAEISAFVTKYEGEDGKTYMESGVNIKADQINLEGYTTINEHFTVNEDGDVTMVDANVTGTITATSGDFGFLKILDSNTITATNNVGFQIYATDSNGNDVASIEMGHYTSNTFGAFSLPGKAARFSGYNGYAGLRADGQGGSNNVGIICRGVSEDTTSEQSVGIYALGSGGLRAYGVYAEASGGTYNWGLWSTQGCCASAFIGRNCQNITVTGPYDGLNELVDLTSYNVFVLTTSDSTEATVTLPYDKIYSVFNLSRSSLPSNLFVVFTIIIGYGSAKITLESIASIIDLDGNNIVSMDMEIGDVVTMAAVSWNGSLAYKILNRYY